MQIRSYASDNVAYRAPKAATKSRVFTSGTLNSFNNTASSKIDAAQCIAFAGRKIKEAFEKPLTLLHLSDTHSNIENIPKLKTAIKAAQNSFDDTLVIHSGDFGLGSGDLEVQVELMNNLGVNLATLGNHEFFVGSQRMAEALKKSEFLTLVNNLSIPDKNPVKELVKTKKFVRSTKKDFNGITYGFIGSTTQDVNKPSYAKLLQGMEVKDAVDEIRAEVEKLEAEGVNRIILISHLGYDIDKEIAQNIPGIDVIAGGHTHIKLDGIKKGQNLFESPRSKEPVLLLHCGEYGENLGVSHLVFSKDGVLKLGKNSRSLKYRLNKVFRNVVNIINPKQLKINNIKATESYLVNASRMPRDAEMEELLESKLTRISNVKRTIRSDWPMWGSNHLGNLTADAVRDLTGAEIALIQPGGLRRNISRGTIYAEYVRSQAIPFDAPLVKVKLTGQQILDALNNGASCAGKYDEKPGLLQVSGLRYSFDMLKPPFERVEAEDVIIDKYKNTLDPDKTYTVGIDKFLHSGGERFKSLKNAEVIQEYPGDCHSSALVKYLKKHHDANRYLFLSDHNRIFVKNRPPETFEDRVMGLKRRIQNTLEEKLSDIETAKKRKQEELEEQLAFLLKRRA